jgi:Immunoglobulin-like domain of bacterial spore germination
VTSPLRLRGTANTFEGTFQVELRAGGKVLAKGSVKAASGTGTRGRFTTSLVFKVTHPTDAELAAYEVSAANGKPIHVFRVPLTLKP